jgi:hypothetical protein
MVVRRVLSLSEQMCISEEVEFSYRLKCCLCGRIMTPPLISTGSFNRIKCRFCCPK